ncbi:MAG: hypothetical protein QOE70_3639 [Chthoniobacter sp.]|jgi:hypothetical protein|nr:hypothetical protein [Chthoniobacter sp.]
MTIRRNPVSVRGRLEQCWLFVYREAAETVRTVLPPPLAPVCHGGFAFWNVVVCRLSGMRTWPLPAAVGLGYWHVAYRLHVQARVDDGPALEGLYFLRSDCDRRLVAQTGNWLTDFNFHLAGIGVADSAAGVRGEIKSPDASAQFQLDRQATPHLAPGSPFATLEEASAALQYRPLALSAHGADALNVVRVLRDEAAWRSRVIAVAEAHWQFLAGRETVLELCYEIDPIEYVWERGRIAGVLPCAS